MAEGATEGTEQQETLAMNQQRKRIWTEQFQTKLFLRIGLYWLIYQLTVWNFLFVAQLVEEGPGDLWEQLGRFAWQQYPTLLCFLIIVPVLAWDAVRFAHRLVGPVVRFRKTLQEMTAGKPVRPIRLRQGDFLTDLQDDFNGMLQSMHEQGVPVLDTTPANAAKESTPAPASH